MDTIISRNNPKIKYFAKLTADASFRKSEGLFTLEGQRLCCDASLSGIGITDAFITENAMKKYASSLDVLTEKSDRVFLVTDEVSARLSDTKNSQGVFCICKTLDKRHNIDKINYNGIYIAVENLQTPSNLGAAARTAEALGLDGMIVSGGCDIYNPKAQRAAMGSLLRLSIIETASLAEFLTECSAHSMKTYAAVPDSSAMPITKINKTSGIVCAVGNEGNGLSDEVINACSHRVTIPMKGRAESLNAASAAAVIMWEMVR